MRMLLALLLSLIPFSVQAEYLGNLSANEYDPNSIANPYGAGNPYIFPPECLGRVIRKTGLSDPVVFFARIERELLPSVQRVRDELAERFPAVKEYIESYALAIEREVENNP